MNISGDRHVNPATFDLNLLRVFDTLMRERSVSRSAERLFLSQPAVSNALGRLRDALGDELFVRRPEGMMPTPRAQELAGPVRTALLELEQSLSQASFDPATVDWTFRVAANDYFTTVVLPTLLPVLREEAPGVDLRLLPQVARAEDYLDANDVDFVFAAGDELPPRYDAIPLLTDDFVCLMRPGHPLTRGRLSVRRFARANHLLVAPTGRGQGLFDARLAELGLHRRVMLTINQFAAAPDLVARSDLIVTLLRRVANRFAEQAGLVTRRAPIDHEPVVLKLIWHRRFGRHPAHDWFRRRLAAVAADL